MYGVTEIIIKVINYPITRQCEMILHTPKLVIVAILALTSSLVSAYDPSPLQDFCVAAKEKDGGM